MQRPVLAIVGLSVCLSRPGSESIQVDLRITSRFYSPPLPVLLTSVDCVSSRLETDTVLLSLLSSILSVKQKETISVQYAIVIVNY